MNELGKKILLLVLIVEMGSFLIQATYYKEYWYYGLKTKNHELSTDCAWFIGKHTKKQYLWIHLPDKYAKTLRAGEKIMIGK